MKDAATKRIWAFIIVSMFWVTWYGVQVVALYR
jgi:hypothetical protein